MRNVSLVLLLLVNATLVNAGSLADPTAPSLSGIGQAAAGTPDTLQLNATYISNNHRYAIINGVKLREGESYGDIRLRRINHKSVEITAGGQSLSLSLSDLIVKTR